MALVLQLQQDREDLREECRYLQLRVENWVDSMAHMEANTEHAHECSMAFLPLMGAWRGQTFPPVVMQQVANFHVPPPLQWSMYPYLEEADTDPLMPYDQGHFLQGYIMQQTQGIDN